jgi:hypothetical protein
LHGSVSQREQRRSIIYNKNFPKWIVAFYVPAASLVGLSFVGCQHEAVLALLCVTVGLNGLNYCGFNANHIDIASNFSGTLMGITNMVANFMGFLAPMAVAAIVEGHVSGAANWGQCFIRMVLFVIS